MLSLDLLGGRGHGLPVLFLQVACLSKPEHGTCVCLSLCFGCAILSLPHPPRSFLKVKCYQSLLKNKGPKLSPAR